MSDVDDRAREGKHSAFDQPPLHVIGFLVLLCRKGSKRLRKPLRAPSRAREETRRPRHLRNSPQRLARVAS